MDNEKAPARFMREMREVMVAVDSEGKTIEIMQSDFQVDGGMSVHIDPEQVDILIVWLKEAQLACKGSI